MANPDFAKSASGRGGVYDSSASGLGLSPSYLANLNANAQAAASGSGGGGGATSGDYADIPDPGDAINEFFYATDTGLLWFSDGITWTSVPDGAIFAGETAGGVLGGNYPNPSFASDMATQAELDAAIAAAVNDGDTAGGVLSGTYPNPGFAADMATQAELNSEASTRSTDDTALGNRITTLEGLYAPVGGRTLVSFSTGAGTLTYGPTYSSVASVVACNSDGSAANVFISSLSWTTTAASLYAWNGPANAPLTASIYVAWIAAVGI